MKANIERDWSSLSLLPLQFAKLVLDHACPSLQNEQPAAMLQQL